MARFDWSNSRPSRVGVEDPSAAPPSTGAVDPVIDIADLAALVRAYQGHGGESSPVDTSVRDAQLSVSRHDPDDFQDRQIYLFVDDEPWGKIRYGETITREVTPGRHRVRAFNTLLSRTLELDLRPEEHARLRCGNGFPRAGFLLMMFLHVTYLLVRLEREPAGS